MRCLAASSLKSLYMSRIHHFASTFAPSCSLLGRSQSPRCRLEIHSRHEFPPRPPRLVHYTMFAACGLCRPQRQVAAAEGSPVAARPVTPSGTAPVAPQPLQTMSRSASESGRILEATIETSTSSFCRSQSAPSLTLLEASQRRLLAMKEREAAAAAEQQGAVDAATAQAFLLAYMKAIEEADVDWASQPGVGQLFREDAVMVAVDKSSFHGRPAIVRRLNQGVKQLSQMAGEQAALPTFTLEGPTSGPSSSGDLVFSLKLQRGRQSMAYTLSFRMQQGLIAQLRNSRGS